MSHFLHVGKGEREKTGGEGTGKGGGEGKKGRDERRRERREDREGRRRGGKISPPKSFLKVGAYDVQWLSSCTLYPVTVLFGPCDWNDIWPVKSTTLLTPGAWPVW